MRNIQKNQKNSKKVIKKSKKDLTFSFFCRKIKYDKKGKYNGFRKKH